MTREERQKYDAFQKELHEIPANRLGFFTSVEGIEEPHPANNPFDRWKQNEEYENKAICKHLGIEYREEDFVISAEELARQWASRLPTSEIS